MSNGQQFGKNFLEYHNYHENGCESRKHGQFSESMKIKPLPEPLCEKNYA